MLLKISKIFLFASLLCVTVVLTTTFFPFIGGKDYFFRFAVELALVFVILWWAFEAEPGEPWEQLRTMFKKPLFVAVTAFVAIHLLATFFALDARSAFWSNYERGEGGFQMLHYYVFFALLIFLLRNKEEWRWFFKTFLLAGALLILYGVFAQLGWADNFISPHGGNPPATLWLRLTNARFQGSLGNPAYVDPYLMFSIFFALYLWATSKFSNKWIPGAVYLFLSVAFLFFFILGQTRGAFLGLVAAIPAFLCALFIMQPKWRMRIALIFAVVALAGGLLYTNRHSAFVKNLPGSRIVDISNSDGTVTTRLWTWGSAWKGFKERPILGWGPENFTAVFDKYFDSRHYVPGANTETWFDRAHSLYFDSLSETGILGFISYFGIFALIFWELFKRRHDRNYSPYEKALLLAILVGYLVQGIAIFDVLPIYINIFTLFAFSYFVFYSHQLKDPGMHGDLHKKPHHAN